MTNLEINNRRSAAVSRGVGVMTQVYAGRAENAEVWDIEGTATLTSLPASPS